MRHRRYRIVTLAFFVGLGQLVRAENPGTAGGHDSVGPRTARPTSPVEPCEALDGTTRKLVLSESDTALGKLFISTVLFSARYKEVAETPSVKKLLRQEGHGVAANKNEDFNSFRQVALTWGIGTSLLLVPFLLYGDPHLIVTVGILGVSGTLSLLASAESVSVRPADTKGRAEAVRASLNSGVSEAAELYAEAFQWNPQQKERFSHLLRREAVEAIKGDAGAPTAVDPLKILEEMHPDRKAELDALKEVRRLRERIAGGEVPADRPVSESLKALHRAAQSLSQVNRDLPSGSRAREEGESLQRRIEEAGKRLREICELYRR